MTLTPQLPEGDYTITVFRDGVNAATVGEDYVIETSGLHSGQSLEIEAAPGGGFAAVIEPAPASAPIPPSRSVTRP